MSHPDSGSIDGKELKKESKRRCICNWGSMCEDYQAKLSNFCVANAVNHVALGYIDVSTAASSSQRFLQSVSEHLLSNDMQPIQVCTRIYVARHHFPIGLLEYNGNRAQVVHGNNLPAMECADKKSKVKHFYPAIPREKAHQFGICDDADRYSHDPSSEHYNLYVQAPLARPKEVEEILLSLMPSSRALQLEARRHAAKQVQVARPLHPYSSNEILADSKTAFTPTPSLCEGLKSQQLELFASASYANQGLCATVYLYNVKAKTWHSPHCTGTTTNGKGSKKSCMYCTKASETVHLSLPAAVNDASDWDFQAMVLSQDQICDLLIKHYNSLNSNDTAFVQSRAVQRAMTILWSIYNQRDAVPLDDHNTFAAYCTTNGENCEQILVTRKKRTLVFENDTCSVCQPQKKHRIESPHDGEKKLSPFHTFKNMSKEQLVPVAQSLAKQVRYKNRKLRDAKKLLLREKNSSFISSDDHELSDLMTSAANFVSKNNESCRQSIILALLKDSKSPLPKKNHRNMAKVVEDAAGAGISDGAPSSKQEENGVVAGPVNKANASETDRDNIEYTQFVDAILEEIESFSRLQKQQTKQIRFSPRVMRIALSLYLQGPTAYEAFRKSNIRVMPSVSTLKRLKAAMTPKEGTFPLVYAWFYDEFLSTPSATKADWYGHILFDEMKLKSDFYWNASNHKCVGIVVENDEDRIDLVKEAQKLYNDSLLEETDDDNNNNDVTTTIKRSSDDKSCYSVSLTVNQFRFRSAANHTHTGEFFFNNGSLSGDELLRQVKQVIMGYEMIGIRILGISCDGGGNNARLFKLLRFGKEPTKGSSWLDDELISFPNPADPTRLIAMSHCTTHGLKNMRNAFLSSQENEEGKRTRDFDIGGTKFSWDTIKRSFDRDKRRSSQDSSLQYGSVYIDKWSKMDVSMAKDPFRLETICELMLFLANALDCIEDVVNVECARGDSGHTKALKQIEILKVKATTNNNVDESIRQDLLSLEYCAVVGTLYLDTFMNRYRSITRENIDDLEATLQKHMLFFESWRESQLMQKEELHQAHPKSKAWEKSFLSHVTYLNMRIGICGFVKYARLLLAQNDCIHSVPFLHSNTSIIEALFSQICGMQRDTPLKYAAGAGAANTAEASKYLNNGSMYSVMDLAYSESPCKKLEQISLRTDERRKKKVNLWLSQRQQHPLPWAIRFSDYAQSNEGLHPSKFSNNQHKMRRALGLLDDLEMNCHYSDALWADADFVEYAKLSIRTTAESSFYAMVKLNEDETVQFDKACQWLFGNIRRCAQSSGASNRSVDRSFMMQVFRFQIDETKMRSFRSQLPRRLNESTVFAQLLVNFVAKLFVAKLHAAIDNFLENTKVPMCDSRDDAGTVDGPVNGSDDDQKEVQFFLGWAMASLSNKYEGRTGGDDDYDKVFKFCREMYKDHDEVILDDEYMRNFYPSIVRVKNRGDLALVSKRYFGFGLELLQQIRKVFNRSTIIKYGTDCVSVAFQELYDNDNLRKSFLSCKNEASQNLRKDVVEKIYKELITKTFHARVGAETAIFKDENTSRFAVDAVDTALREGLKVIAKRQRKTSKGK